jgi:hypothetical protein
MKDEPYDSGNETQVKHKKTRAQLREETHKADWRAQMSSVQGRRFVWAWLSETGIYRDCTATESYQLGRFAGKRSFGLQILGELLSICPNEYLLMQSEAMKAQQEEKNNG